MAFILIIKRLENDEFSFSLKHSIKIDSTLSIYEDANGYIKFNSDGKSKIDSVKYAKRLNGVAVTDYEKHCSYDPSQIIAALNDVSKAVIESLKEAPIPACQFTVNFLTLLSQRIAAGSVESLAPTKKNHGLTIEIPTGPSLRS